MAKNILSRHGISGGLARVSHSLFSKGGIRSGGGGGMLLDSIATMVLNNILYFMDVHLKHLAILHGREYSIK